MPNYRVLLAGRNFPPMQGKRGPTGFYTTRWVRASDEETAETKAVDLVRRELKKIWPEPPNGFDLEPSIHLDKIERIGWHYHNIGRGFTFFPMDE